MRYWGTKIKIDGTWIKYSNDKNNDNTSANPDAEYYEVNMQNILRGIASNAVGKIVLDAINQTSHTVTLRPVAARAIDKGQAIADSDSALERKTGDLAPGAGSEVTVWYKTAGINVQGYYYRSDDGVLHECVHALRMARGWYKKTPVADFENEEELFAVMVTNMFASVAKRKSDLRGSHAKVFAPMRLSGPEFASKFNLSLVNFRFTSSDIYGSLVKIDAPWNPLKPFDGLLSAFN